MAALLLIGAPRLEAADTRQCRSSGGGYGSIVVEERGDSWAYVVTLSGPKCVQEPYGRHAPGALVCEGCSAWGLYHLIPGSIDKLPTTAAERSRRRSEVFGYAPLMLGAAELEPEAAREGITLGPLKGYAVRYALKLPPEKMPDPGDGRKLGLLVLSLTDGCVIFEPTLLLRGAGEAPWTGPESLLAELVIDRKPSCEAQFPVPPRKTAPKGAR